MKSCGNIVGSSPTLIIIIWGHSSVQENNSLARRRSRERSSLVPPTISLVYGLYHSRTEVMVTDHHEGSTPKGYSVKKENLIKPFVDLVNIRRKYCIVKSS